MAESRQQGIGLCEIQTEDKHTTMSGHLAEFEKLDVLLSKIPLKAQSKFITTYDLILTCIDANSSYIVLGANVGLIYVFSREDNSIQRIKVADASTMITSVKIHSGEDHFVAAGTSIGHFCIYCIPSKTSTLGKKEIKKFEVKHVHKYYITCVEWSTNGMKLCTGDTKGQVAVTCVDFYEDKCTSVVLLIDAGNEIVQLSYDHKVLAVSTTQKSYIVRLDQNDRITNIGSEDHMISGKFGACFIPCVCKTDDALLYVARPSCNLWLSDMEGKVINEQAFSLSQTSEMPGIILLSGEPNESKVTEEFQFGKLKMFRDKEIVSWSNVTLVVVDPCSNKVVGYHDKFSHIVDVAVVNRGEIFILQRNSGARVIRIANKPDLRLGKNESDPPTKQSPLPPPPVQAPVVSRASEKVFDNGGKAALSFLKKNLVQPLKKLDNFIVNDSEKVTVTSNIPDAKIKSDPVPDAAIASESEASGLSKTGEEEKQDPIQPRTIIDNIKVDQMQDEGSIIFTPKLKKHKKKNVKKGHHTGQAKEDKKGDSHSQSHSPTEVADSATEALKRADSLLERLNAGGIIDQNQMVSSENVISGIDDEATERKLSYLSEFHEERLAVQHDTYQDEKSEGNEINHDISVKHNVCSGSHVKSETSEKSTGAVKVHVLENNNLETQTQIEVLASNINADMAFVNKNMSDFNVSERNVSPPHCDNTNGLNECVEKALNSLHIETEDNTTDKDDMAVRDDVAENNSGITKGKKQTPHLHIDPLGLELTGSLQKSDTMEMPMEDLYKALSFFKSGSSYDDESTEEPAPLTVLNKSHSITSSLVTYQLQNIPPKPDANIWSELRTPTNIYSVSISDWHIWYTDRSENIYHSSLKEGTSALWKKASGKANQISVSPCGQIVWCLHKKVILAGTKITSRHPEGLKWVEDARGVDCISVDDNCAWYITEAGSIMVQTNLSPQYPLTRPKKVPCPYKLKTIVCRYGVVWGITERLQLLVRKGVTSDCLQGNDWELHPREDAPYMFTYVSIGHDQVGWALDILGQVWFCTGVCMENPLGCGRWWQVPVSEILMLDDNTRQLIKEVAQKFDPVKFSHMISTVRGGFITISAGGLFVTLDFNNVFNVCKGSIQGFQWIDGRPSHSLLPSTTVWKLICANVSHTDRGFIWVQNVHQDLYTFKLARGFGKLIDKSLDFTSISTNNEAVWATTSEGRIVARQGINDACPEGTGWQVLDLMQLGDVHFVHISCSALYVWAVDSDGEIYHRIGAQAVGPEELSPIWLQIDCYSEIIFTKIYTGSQDWMVWAIDNRRLIYTRGGVHDNLPIGREWMHVTGIQAMDITLSKSGAWVLSMSGEVFYRQNVRRENVCGSHWQKIPGLFTKISASAEDDLWGITIDGDLQQCNTQNIVRSQTTDASYERSNIRSSSSSSKEEIEWVFL